MTGKLSRREFLKTIAISVGALSATQLIEREPIKYAILPKNCEIIGPKRTGILDQFYIMGWKGSWKGHTYAEAIKFTDLDLVDIVKEKLTENAYAIWMTI